MSHTITYEHIPSTDPRLGRHVRHDSRSFLYRVAALPTEALVSVKHTRDIPVLDQGTLGSCTGNAAAGAIGTEPLFPAFRATFPNVQLDEPEAVSIYHFATLISSPATPYPPNDPGSDGLSVAQAAKNAGLISGYQHAMGLADALTALQAYPVITGVNWYQGMFTPDPDGRLQISGPVAGGHEFVVDEIDVANQRVWMTNSWGSSWGINGRAYLTWADWDRLLSEQGDVTVLLPLSVPAPAPSPTPTPVPVPPAPPAPPTPPEPPQPAPTPTPDPQPVPQPVDNYDQDLADVVVPWLNRNPFFYRRVQKALRSWLVEKGLA